MMANIIMLGFVVGINQVVSYNSLKNAVATSVPERTVEKNMAGMERGFKYGRDLLAEKE